MSSKIEGCCCPPKGYAGAWAAGPCPVHQGFRAMITKKEDAEKVNSREMGLLQFVEKHGAAPVVERQPTGQWRISVSGDWFYGTYAQCVREREEYESTFTDLDREEAGVVVPEQIYSGAPPELAELQATIAQLKNEVGEAKGEYDRSANKVAQLTADLTEEKKWRESAEGGWREANKVIAMQREKLDEIERLKGGQSEPVAWRYKKTYQKEYWSVSLVEPVAAFLLNEETHDIQPLYTSQPALVSVLLPERRIVEKAYEACDVPEEQQAIGWNDCLDQVKALNP